MKGYLKTGLTLFLICAVCSVLCGFVNQITAPVIEENQRKSNLEALAAVSGGLYPSSDEVAVDSNEHVKSYTPLYSDVELTKLAGYSLTLSGRGYGGEFTIVASYYLDGSLISAKMTSDSETAGLGKKAEEDWYMAMFQGKGSDTPIPTSKDALSESEAASVSGASITFAGVTSSLSEGSRYVKEDLNGNSH